MRIVQCVIQKSKGEDLQTNEAENVRRGERPVAHQVCSAKHEAQGAQRAAEREDSSNVDKDTRIENSCSVSILRNSESSPWGLFLNWER